MSDEGSTVASPWRSTERASQRQGEAQRLCTAATPGVRGLLPILLDDCRARPSSQIAIDATISLALSVIGDGVLTALKLRGTPFCADALIPVVSMAIEVICIGLLVCQMRRMTWQTRSTAALLKAGHTAAHPRSMQS